MEFPKSGTEFPHIDWFPDDCLFQLYPDIFSSKYSNWVPPENRPIIKDSFGLIAAPEGMIIKLVRNPFPDRIYLKVPMAVRLTTTGRCPVRDSVPAQAMPAKSMTGQRPIRDSVPAQAMPAKSMTGQRPVRDSVPAQAMPAKSTPVDVDHLSKYIELKGINLGKPKRLCKLQSHKASNKKVSSDKKKASGR